MGRKSAANEELSVVPSKKRRKRRRKAVNGERVSLAPEPMTMAEEHDL